MSQVNNRTSDASIADLRSWLRSPWTVLAIIGALIPAIVLAIYIKTYAAAYPFGDVTSFSAPTAIQTVRGELTPAYLFSTANGHRIFFTRMVTVLLTVFTNWNIEYELVVNFVLGIINLILVIALFFRYYPRYVRWFLIPCSALMLTLQESPNWLIGVQSTWHFVLMFVLLGIVTLCYGRRNLTTIIIAAFFAVCASFSFATGLSAWLLLIITMWMVGYRQRRYYLLIILLAAVVTVAFFLNSGIGVASQDALVNNSTVVLPRLSISGVSSFIITFLGGPLAADNVSLAFPLGAIGLIIVTMNFYLIQRFTRTLRTVAPWIGLTLFALCSGFLISMGRTGYYGESTPITKRYLQPATCLWISIVATTIVVIFVVLPKLHLQRRRLLRGVFGILAIGFTSLYLVTVVSGAGIIEYGELASSIPESGACSQAFIFTRDTSCLRRSSPYYLDLLAYYDLAGYAAIPNRLILPDSYKPGDQVVVATGDTWLNYHIADRLLKGVPESDIYALIPKEADAEDSGRNWVRGLY